jgi:hypothetical protein
VDDDGSERAQLLLAQHAPWHPCSGEICLSFDDLLYHSSFLSSGSPGHEKKHNLPLGQSQVAFFRKVQVGSNIFLDLHKLGSGVKLVHLLCQENFFDEDVVQDASSFHRKLTPCSTYNIIHLFSISINTE